jgi:GxxExxY protein
MSINLSTLNQITHGILGAAIEIHRALGPGLLESAYLQCLQWELGSRKFRFSTQRVVPIVYKNTTLDTCYRVDLVVEDLVIVEAKSVAELLPVYHAQTLTYMRLTGCPAGLLINFNVPRLMDGVKRLINTPRDSGPTESAPHETSRVPKKQTG